MKCLNCNNEIDDNSNFCEYCGMKLENNVNIINNQMNNNVSNQNIMLNTNSNTDNINNGFQTGFSSNLNVNNNVMMNSQNQNNNLNESNGLNQVVNYSVNNNMLNNSDYNMNTNVDNNLVNTSIENNQMQNDNTSFNNNMNTDFKTLEGVEALFRSKGGLGTDNCIFIAFKDQNVHATRTAVSAGAFGVIGSMISRDFEDLESSRKMDKINDFVGINNYDALIINIFDLGISFIPLLKKEGGFLINLNDCIVDINNYAFVSRENIESIVFKKLTILSSKVQKLTIKIKNGVVFDLTANKVEKNIPYQQASMEKLISIYGK